MKKLLMFLVFLTGFFAVNAGVVVTFDYIEAFKNKDLTDYFINGSKMYIDANGLLNSAPTSLKTLSKKVKSGTREYEVVIEFEPVLTSGQFAIARNSYGGATQELCLGPSVKFKVYVRNSSGKIGGDLRHIYFMTPTTSRAQLLENLSLDTEAGSDAKNENFSNYGSNPPQYKRWWPVNSLTRPVQVAHFAVGTSKVSGYNYPIVFSQIEVEFEPVDKYPFTPLILPQDGHYADENNTTFFINELNVVLRLDPEDAAANPPMDLFRYYPKAGDNKLAPPTVNEYLVQHGYSERITGDGTLWLYAGNPQSWDYLSDVNEMLFSKLTADEFSCISELTGIKSGADLPHSSLNERKIVTFSQYMNVNGVYETDQGNTFVFLRDQSGDMIRCVAPSGFNKLRKGEWVAPRGIAGRYMHNDGMPEIDITDYVRYCGESVANMPVPIVVPESDTRDNISLASNTPIVTENDFNKHLVLRNVTWEENGYISDRNGNKFRVYPRFLGYEIAAIEPGTDIRLECFVSKVSSGLILIPVRFDECDPRPIVRFKSGNRISGTISVVDDKIEWEVESLPEGSYYCRFGDYTNDSDGWIPARAVTAADFKDYGNGVKLCKMQVATSLDAFTSSVETVTFELRQKTTLHSIKELKNIYLDANDNRTSVSTNAYYLIDGDVVIERKGDQYLYVRDNINYKDASGNEIADAKDHHLLIFNPNGWDNPQFTFKNEDGTQEVRSLREGDVVTTFVFKPEFTSLGLLRGNAFGFTPSYTLATNPDGTYVKPVQASTMRTLEVSYDKESDPTYYTKYLLETKNRMMLYRFENVKVEVKDNSDAYGKATVQPDGTRVDTEGNIVDPVIYQMVVGDRLNVELNLFPTALGGWTTAFPGAGNEYNITIEGIVVDDKASPSRYSMALSRFETPEIATAPKGMRAVNDDDVEKDEETGEISYSHSAKVVIDLADNSHEGAVIYYTTDGTDPKTNRAVQRYDSNKGIMLSNDHRQTTIRAYSVWPGATPSSEIIQVFKRKSQEVPYIPHFTALAVPDVPYHFNRPMRIVATGGDYMFVRDLQGNYLGVRRESDSKTRSARTTNRWEGYEPGHYVTDFVVEADHIGEGDNKVLRGAVVTSNFVQYLTASSAEIPKELLDINTDIEVDPNVISDKVDQIDPARHIGRLVTLNYAFLDADTQSGNTDWTLIPDRGNLMEHKVNINDEVLEYNMPAEIDTEHNFYNVTGFVMPTEDGGYELWPVDIDPIEITDSPEVECDENGVITDLANSTYTVKFYPSTMVTLSYAGKNSAYATIHYLVTPDRETPTNGMKWTTYGQPFAVTENCYIRTYVSIPGMDNSANTTIVMIREDSKVEDIDFRVSSGNGHAEVELVPTDATVKDYTILYSINGGEPNTIYTAPIKIAETTTIKAILIVNGKSGQICKAVIPVGSTDRMSGAVSFTVSANEQGVPVVTLSPEDNLTPGTYEIYYSTDASKPVAISEECRYKTPIELPNGGFVMAILVQDGKLPGRTQSFNVGFVNPTGIEGVDADAAGVKVENGTILAPEGSKIYDVTGRPVVSGQNLRSGIYIVVTPEGQAVKLRLN